ncbi:HNH endonuclease signature motif containing protein [Terrihalobacillus insolitus]|uniref:HNH endonuclease signature motif containing protein n=1 Tax=Terrihalobacillus insolitus TaxID=2950438 RepID=UPI0023424C73|nr:HNH endonuclease signature motif containing protein [Terrihalobacillus insolitus]MDC3412548.1 HNH endonuclease [Terrihalobacillus insolitus]
MHKYTKEQVDFIKKHVKDRSSMDLLELFNARFGLNLGLNQIRAFKKNHNLKSGVNTSFKKGQEAWNKGLKGINFGGKETQFKKGQKPANHMHVGAERINGDGYVDIKIAEPSKWRGKHLLIWEAENGPLPPGHAVIFGDGNKQNFDLDNLILVSRKQLAILNRKNLIQSNADLTRTGVLVADLHSKISDRK